MRLVDFSYTSIRNILQQMLYGIDNIVLSVLLTFAMIHSHFLSYFLL